MSSEYIEPHVITVSAAFELLTTTMQDPLSLDACVRRMCVAADRIDQALEARSSLSEQLKLAKSHPDFLRAGIKFLIVNRNKEDWTSMMNHLAECRCGLSNLSPRARRRMPHYSNRSRCDGRMVMQVIACIFDVVSTVATCIILALSNLTQNKFYSGPTASGNIPWPQSAEDLIPYGPQATVTGLKLWLFNPPEGHIIFKLAARLTFFHAPFSPELFDPDLAVERPLRYLDVTIKFYEEGNDSPLAREYFFSKPVVAVLQFFEDLALCDISRFNRLIIERRTWLLPTLPRLKDIMRSGGMRQEWSRNAKIVWYLIGCAHLGFDEETGAVSINIGSIVDMRELDGAALEQALKVIIQARSMGCWNISCTSPPEDVQLRVCRRCDLMRFCGEECQKQAWKSDLFPHKEVCSQIHALKASLGVHWSRIWTQNFTYGQFRAICMANNIDTWTVEEISATLCKVRKYRNQFLKDPAVLVDRDAPRKMVLNMTLESGEVVRIL